MKPEAFTIRMPQSIKAMLAELVDGIRYRSMAHVIAVAVEELYKKEKGGK